MTLTKNFDLHEFSCNDGTQVPPIYHDNVIELAKNLQILRDYIKQPISINSAYRHRAYNTRIGGKPNSMHLTASAADITVKSMSPRKLKGVIEKLIAQKKMYFGGIGLYPGFVHVDIRDTPARW